MPTVPRTLVIAVLCLLGFSAQAATVSIAADGPVLPGEDFIASVIISDVGGLALEAWDLTVGFDGDVFDFIDGAHGPGLTDSGVLLFGPITNSPSTGVAKLSGSALSGIIPAEGSVLFELAFHTLGDAAPGDSLMTIDLTVNEETLLQGGGMVQVTPIPVPAAVWLFGTALFAGFYGFRRKLTA